MRHHENSTYNSHQNESTRDKSYVPTESGPQRIRAEDQTPLFTTIYSCWYTSTVENPCVYARFVYGSDCKFFYSFRDKNIPMIGVWTLETASGQGSKQNKPTYVEKNKKKFELLRTYLYSGCSSNTMQTAVSSHQYQIIVAGRVSYNESRSRSVLRSTRMPMVTPSPL